MRERLKDLPILTAKQATGVGNSVRVGSYKHKELTLSTAGMVAGDTITVKISGSNSETCPTFSSAKSNTNKWDYVNVIDSMDGTPYDGDTGITFTTSDDVRTFSINKDGLEWVTVEVTTISDTTNTSVTATLNLYND